MSLLTDLSIPLPPEWGARYRAAMPSADLLAETVPFAAARRIAIMGGAADPLVLIAAQRAPSADVLVADDDAAAGGRLRELAARMGLIRLRPIDPAALQAATHATLVPFDMALANTLYHPSKSVTLTFLALAHALLAPEGRLFVAGAKDRGIRSIEDEVERLFGNVTTLALRKGHRVITAARGSDPANPYSMPAGNSETSHEEVIVRGQSLVLTHEPAVFAGGRLDPAAALLAETMEAAPAAVVADLGCGAGVVGLVAARLAPRGHIYLLDSSYAAVRLAEANARRNGIANATALIGDVLAPLREAGVRPTVIVANPPFHAGQVQSQVTALRFMAESAERLAPGGQLYLVANRFLPYEAALGQHFGQVRELAGDARFKVLLAEEARPPA